MRYISKRFGTNKPDSLTYFVRITLSFQDLSGPWDRRKNKAMSRTSVGCVA